MDDAIPPPPEHDLLFRPDLLSVGVTDDQIARLIRSRVLARVRNGVYCPAEIWAGLGPRQRHIRKLTAALASSRCEAVGSHISAAVVHTESFWGLDLDEVHLSRLDGRSGRREAGVRQHRGRLTAQDVVRVDGLAVTSACRTVLDLCSIAPLEQGLIVTEALLHAGLTTLDSLRLRLAETPAWPGSLRTAHVLRLAEPRNSTPGETRAWLLFYRQAIPAPIPQYEVRDHDGSLVAVVDFAWPELGLFVEFDGRHKYGRLLRPGETAAAAVYREKQREDRIRELTGWRCVRLTWADLDDPARTAARIRRSFAVAASAF